MTAVPETARRFDNDVSEDYSDHPMRDDTTSARALIQRATMVVGGRPAELARRLKVTGSHVSRIRKGVAGMGVETCLRLADVLDADPIVVLRACGYARLCELLDLLRQGQLPRRRARLHD